MGSKTRLGSYCTKPANNGVNLVTSRNINTRLARPIGHETALSSFKALTQCPDLNEDDIVNMTCFMPSLSKSLFVKPKYLIKTILCIH